MPWPPEKKAIDIGNFYADSSTFPERRRLGAARRRCATGFARTIAFYRAHADAYLDDPAPTPSTVA